MEIAPKRDIELIRIIEVDAPPREAGRRSLIWRGRDLSTDKNKNYAGHSGYSGTFFPMKKAENPQQNLPSVELHNSFFPATRTSSDKD